jgi:hypothetical protein
MEIKFKLFERGSDAGLPSSYKFLKYFCLMQSNCSRLIRHLQTSKSYSASRLVWPDAGAELGCSGWNEECKSRLIPAGDEATPKAQPLTSASVQDELPVVTCECMSNVRNSCTQVVGPS